MDKKVTILYGENGNGKSSFFDAIEWCLTGEIKRFPAHSDLKKALANKEMDEDDICYVEVYFSDLILRRSFNKLSEGYSNQEIVLFKEESGTRNKKKKIANGNKQVNEYLKEGNLAAPNSTKLSTTELLSKTYVLSQDQINNFVTRDKPEDRYHSLSSIMGFDKAITLMKNIRKSNRIMENKITTIKTSLADNTNEITKQNDKQNKINKELISKFKEKSNIRKIDYSSIEKYRIESRSKVQELQDLLASLKKIEKNLYTYTLPELYKRYKVERVKNDEKLGELVNKSKSLSNKLSEQKEKAEMIKSNNQKKEEVNSIRKKMIKLKKEINEITKEELIEEIESKDYNLRKIKFALINQQALKDLQKENSEVKNKIESLQKNYNQKVVMRDEVILKEKHFNEKLLNDNENSASKILVESLESIKKFIDRDDVDKNICPACSTNVGDGLSLRIDDNVQKVYNQLSKSKEELNEIIKLKNKYKKEKEGLLNELRDIKKNKSLEERQESVYDAKIDDIRNHVDYDQELMEQEQKKLNNLHLNNAYELYEIEKQVRIRREYNRLNNILSESVIYDDIEKEINSESLNQEIQNIERDNKEIITSITGIRKLTEERSVKINFYESLIERLARYDKQLENKKIENLNHIFNQNKENYLDILSLIDPVIEQLKKIGDNNHVKESVNELKRKGQNYETDLDQITKDLEDMVTIYEGLSAKYGEEAVEFLNSPSSAIKLYYSYLNPNPSEYRNLYFEIKQGNELYINVQHNNVKDDFTDVSTVLSSGQLNVLAIAIFLATNESQEFSNFNFIAIDDPIQNMDDVNRFSICDVLSNFNKQIIFSTHDEEFLNLFLKKNEKKIKDINLYHLDSHNNKSDKVIFEYI